MKQTDRNTNKIKSIVKALTRWYLKNARDLPWRRDPYFKDPYCVYVSEIMLQQTQVKTVIPYWDRWMRALPNLRSLAKARPERVLKLWEGLGYYIRVRNLQAAARQICREHKGNFPTRFEDVLSLPGIGRYTAGAICSIAFNQPTPVLDGNVIRVLCRLFALDSDPREKSANEYLWRLSGMLVAEAARHRKPTGGVAHIRSAGKCSRLNQALMELGAVVCTPRNPACTLCPVRRLCLAARSGRVDELPKLALRPKATQRRFVAFILQNHQRIMVQQRPAGVVNADFWEFPNTEVSPENIDLLSAAQCFFKAPIIAVHPFCSLQHTITRYRIRLDAYRVQLEKPPGVNGKTTRWITRKQLSLLPFTSAHRKIAKKL